MQDPAVEKSAAWVILAHLLRPQGRRGEVLAELLTDFPERFADRQGVSLRRLDGRLDAVTVESHWLPVGRNAGRVVLKLQGVDSIDAAEALADAELVVATSDRVSLDEEDEDSEYGAEYIADLLDCALFNGEHNVGTVHDVHFPTNTAGIRLEDAAPLLVVLSASGDELLIPFAKSWIESIDIAQKRITMHLPEGLLEINS